MSDLPEWKGRGRVAIDCETIDPQLKKLGVGTRRDGKMVGVSFAFEDENQRPGQSFYLPFGHKGGDNMDPDQVKRYLKAQCGAFDGQVVGANLPYDLDYMAENDITFDNTMFFRDVQIADPLIYELHFNYSLAHIGDRHGIKSKDEQLIRQAAENYGVDPKAGIGLLPARFVGAYAERDVTSPLEILRAQEKKIEANGLWDIWNLESRVLPVLVKLRRRGVRIDTDKLSHIEDWSLKQEAEALAEVHRQTGIDIGVGNVWKADALAPVLEHIGVRLRKTAQGKPNIDQDVLGSIEHPVAGHIAWARKVNKLRTTFAKSVRTHMVNGRIHSTFNQMARESDSGKDGDTQGARYGRLSCVLPNLQQQPSRDEFADMWRSIYVPEEGAMWGCLDYSQQEPRWTTHFAAKMNLRMGPEAAKRYRDDPTTDNHDMMTDIVYGVRPGDVGPKEFKRLRGHCKIIYLKLCYGGGGASTCDDLGLPTRWAVSVKSQHSAREVYYFDTQREAMQAKDEFIGETFMWRAAGSEGQAILDQFDKNAPFVKKLAKAAEKRAKQKGFITTVGGRRLHFPEGNRGGFDFTHKALNRLIQGSAADQTKTAMVAADEAGHFLQLQVHDEFDGSFGSVEEGRACAEVMSTCIPNTLVPFKVDVEMGPSWGEIKDVNK